MSRHRDIRSMNYSDEYDGYDDVYGHSVEDDYCGSPGAEQFMYDRNKQQNIASFITESKINEDDEDQAEKECSESYKKPELSELENVKFISCLEAIRNVIGDTIPENLLTSKIIEFNFDAEVALDNILKSTPPKNSPVAVVINKDRPDPQSDLTAERPTPRRNLTPQSKLFRPSNIQNSPSESKEFSSLSDLIVNHTSSRSNIGSPSSLKLNSLSKLVNNHETRLNQAQEISSTPESKKSFFSLAEMTANRLSYNSVDKSVCKPTFIIPKFGKKLGKSSTIASSHEQEKNSFGRSDVNEDVEKMCIDDSKSVINNSPSISTDDWVIDLTAALRSVNKDSKTVNELTKKTSQTTKNYYDISDYLAEPIPSSLIVENLELLDCKLNCTYLSRIKISSSNKTPSNFGQMLCRKWRLRRPQIKRIESEYRGKIKQFDFTSPSPDALVLANLRR